MGQKILIVDDDPLTRKNLISLLTKYGHQASAVKSGERALEAIEKDDYDMALIDLKMPKMNGIQLLNALKDRRPDIYVVIITAYASVETAIEAMRLGAFDYIRKPFRTKELLAVIGKVFEEERFEKRLIEQKTIVPEGDVFDSFLKNAKTKHAMGLTIENPSDIIKKYKIKDIPFYQITPRKGKGTFKPYELNKMFKHINNFIKKKNDCIVLIHGIEVLIKHNSKKDFNEFLVKLNASFKNNKSFLMISANSLDLDKDDIFELEDVLSGDYTQLMSEALANPIRRDILRLLAKVESASFTKILKNIHENDSAKFSFHIKKLTSYEVILKDDKGNYKLTKRGNNLISILKNIEGERIKESTSDLLISSS